MLSREPGSRLGMELYLFATWRDNVVARGFVIENIFMFIPFGILFPYEVPFLRKIWFCIPTACLCSICIEGVQFITGRGYCQLDDVVMNTVGAGIGWLFYGVFLHWGLFFMSAEGGVKRKFEYLSSETVAYKNCHIRTCSLFMDAAIY